MIATARAAIAIVIAAWVGVANAQEMPEGGMPDPREMSGIPRPDEKVPKGTITVKLTRGELGRYAPAGTPVHLVEFRPDGSAHKRTAPVDAEGRAEFSGLDAGGTTVYWAFAVDRGDRLESEMVQLPPMVGVRMMLTSRKSDESGNPVGDPIDDAAQDELPEAPSGEIWVFLSRDLAPGTKVHLREIGSPSSVEVAATLERAHVIAKFKDPPTDPAKVFVAELHHAGRTLRSRPFQVVPTAGLTTFIIGGNQLRMQIQGGGQLDEEKIWFDINFAVTNVGSSPYDPGPKGLLIPLPKGARNVKVQEEMSTRVTIADGGVVWNGLIPPGPNPVLVQFALEMKRGSFAFDLPAPFGIEFARVAIERATGAKVRGGAIRTEDHVLQGKPFWIVDTTATPGGAVKFEGVGFPQPPRAYKIAGWVAGAIVLILLGWAVVTALVARDAKPSAAGEAHARRELQQRRDRLYEQLVALERRRAAGKIDPDSFERERKTLVARLVVVHRELDG